MPDIIELFFRAGFAVACAIAATSIAAWSLIILPDWVRRRRERKTKGGEA